MVHNHAPRQATAMHDSNSEKKLLTSHSTVNGAVAPQITEGVVQALRFNTNGKEASLQAVVRTDAGDAQALYMHGGDVLGVVEVDHRVRFQAEPSTHGLGIAEAQRLENLTTNTWVSVWDPPFWSRVVAIARSAVPSALIGPLVGAVVVWLLQSSSSRTISPGGIVSVGTLVVVSLVALLVAFVTFRMMYFRPREQSRAALTAASGGAEKSSQSSDRPIRINVADWAGVAVFTLSVFLTLIAAYLAALAIETL